MTEQKSKIQSQNFHDKARGAFGKIVLAFSITSLIALGIFYLGVPFSTQKQRLIAITQIVPHASLDTIRQGVMDELSEGGVSEKEILFENAMGNIGVASQIAQRFASLNPDVIVPITTPSAQAVASVAKEHDIPVIFTAVSDPVGAKLLNSMNEPLEQVTGVSDLSPLSKQLDLILKIIPRLKVLGALYNPGEINSVILIEHLEKLCEEKGITLAKAAVPSIHDIPAATRSLTAQAQALYFPNDNSIASALPSLLQVAQEAKVPVFSADPESVERGCLATVAHNQYQLGRQVGKMVLAYLGGKAFHDIKPAYGEKVDTVINLEVADELGLDLPKQVTQEATKVVERSAKL